MKRLALVFLVFVALLSATLSYAQATEAMPGYRYGGGSPGHYYQVQFDGEGEASVLAKIVTMNTGTGNLSTIIIEIPGQSVELKYVFQEVPQKSCSQECIGYDSQCTSYEKVCTTWDATSSTCLVWQDRCSNYQQICKGWTQRCYTNYWNTNFVPLSYTSEKLSKSTKYTLKLNESIAAGETSSVLLSYKVTGYVGKLVNYKFDFETIKQPVDISYLRVAVSVDSDLYLRGLATRTDYIPAMGTMESAGKATALGEAVGGTYADQLRSYSQGLTYASGYVREKSNLDPWESFHVTGKYNYADFWFLTYGWEIIAIIIILGAFWIVGKRFLFARIKQAFRPTAAPPSPTVPTKPAKAVPTVPQAVPMVLPGRFIRVTVVGFLAASLLVFVWWAVFTLMSILPWEFRYGMWGALWFIVAFAVIVLSLVGPSILMGLKYGITEGFLTAISTIIWLTILMFALALVFGGQSPVFGAMEQAMSGGTALAGAKTGVEQQVVAAAGNLTNTT